MTTLYTDGSTEATKEQVEAALAILEAAELAAAAQATADSVQAYIDGNAKLSSAGVAAAPDATDPTWVRLVLPADQSAPYFWAAAAGQIVDAYGGKWVTQPTTVRVRSTKAQGHLDVIAAAL